jgi:hypothetical protein
VAYRTQAEREKDAEPEAGGLRCTRCDVPVPRSEDPRCPQCLRRSTVVDPKGLTAFEKTAIDVGAGVAPVATGSPARAPILPVVWPYNQTCPICGEREVGDATIFLRISNVSGGFRTVGTVTAGLFVRLRCCAECRVRVARLAPVRYAMLALFFLGMLLALVSFTREVRSVFLGIVGAAMASGALATVRRRDRAALALLDASGLLAEMAALVPAPSGSFDHQQRVLHARLPAGQSAVELLDVLRTAHGEHAPDSG